MYILHVYVFQDMSGYGSGYVTEEYSQFTQVS